jgi:hypothetical protein
MMLELTATLITRWTWLGYIFLTPGFAIRNALAKLGVIAPQTTAGHMPDFSPAIVFDLTLNFVLVFALLYVFPNFLSSFFPRREKA